MHGTLESLGLQRSWMGNPEWQPFKWYAHRDHTNAPLARKQLLVTWAEGQGYVFQEDTLKLVLPDQTAAGLKAILTSTST